MINRDARVYWVNASAMWRALEPAARTENGCLRVDLPTVTRFLVTRPVSLEFIAGIVAGRRGTGRWWSRI